jgi:hypothetical protein
MDECPQTLDDQDGFTHECIHDKGHDQMHECVCHLMWDAINPQETETRCGECGGRLTARSYVDAPNLTAACDDCGTPHGARINPQAASGGA